MFCKEKKSSLTDWGRVNSRLKVGLKIALGVFWGVSGMFGLLLDGHGGDYSTKRKRCALSNRAVCTPYHPIVCGGCCVFCSVISKRNVWLAR